MPAVSCMHLDVYDLNLDFVARLDGAFDKEVRIALNAAGSGRFSISRHDPNATSAILVAGYTVRVTIDDIDDEEPCFEFFMRDGTFDVISSQEEGGEDLHFSGPGTLDILNNAVLWHENFTGTAAFLDAANGQWHYTTEHAGDIMRRGIVEAIERGVLANVTRTFFDETDTDGELWGYELEDWRQPIGSGLYDETMKLVDVGLIQIEMDPGFILNAYQTLGRDLTGGAFGAGVVRFEKGVNIASELVRDRPQRVYATTALIRKADGTYTTSNLDSYDPSYSRETYIELPTTDNTLAESGGDNILARKDEAQLSLTLAVTVPRNGVGSDEGAGSYWPSPRSHGNGQYWVGDTISVYTGAEEWDVDGDFRIYGLTLRETEAGELDSPILEVGRSATVDADQKPTPAGTPGEGPWEIRRYCDPIEWQVTEGDKWVIWTTATVLAGGLIGDEDGQGLLEGEENAAGDVGLYVLDVTTGGLMSFSPFSGAGMFVAHRLPPNSTYTDCE